MTFIKYLLFFYTVNLLSQSNSDTTYFDNGNLKSAKLLSNIRDNSHAIRFYRESQNALDENIPLYDSLLVGNGSMNQKFSDKIIYYNDSTSLKLYHVPYYIEGDQIKDFKGVYSYLFREFDDLSISVHYNSDTSISRFRVSQFDVEKKGYSSKALYFDGRITTSPGVTVFVNCGEIGVTELIFSDNNFLKMISFYRKNKKHKVVYEFLDDFNIKSYSHHSGNSENRIDKLYHMNGNIKKVSVFKTKEKGGELISEKYFDLNGNLLGK